MHVAPKIQVTHALTPSQSTCDIHIPCQSTYHKPSQSTCHTTYHPLSQSTHHTPPQSAYHALSINLSHTLSIFLSRPFSIAHLLKLPRLDPPSFFPLSSGGEGQWEGLDDAQATEARAAKVRQSDRLLSVHSSIRPLSSVYLSV